MVGFTQSAVIISILFYAKTQKFWDLFSTRSIYRLAIRARDSQNSLLNFPPISKFPARQSKKTS